MNEINGIPVNELKNRWMKTQALMRKDEFDALIIPLGINFNYFFAKRGMPSERLIAGIIPSDGDPFIISPSFEKSNIEITTPIEDIVVWGETESPYNKLDESLKDRGVGNNIIVDPKLWYVEVDHLSKINPGRKFNVATLIDLIRREKSNWEIEQLQNAAKYSAEGILAAIDNLKEGITEKEFVPYLQKELSERSGNPLSFALVQFGENSAIPHGTPTDKKLKNNTSVLLDVGTSSNGYQGDITITVPFGQPSDKFKEIYDIVYQANRQAFEANRQAVIPSELDEIARKYITDKGYGKYFTHRLGHGIGLEVHEHPYIVGSNKEPLVSGDTHTIEPGIYIPGEFGVRIEDDVIVREKNCEFLFETPRYTW
jgi:Xaa-Pro dipeptidase